MLYYVLKGRKSFRIISLCLVFVLYFMNDSMTCYCRLNFYYYVQIVPARRALWIWVKRNMKSVMICTFLFDQMVLLINGFARALSNWNMDFTYSNSTRTEFSSDLDFLNLVCFYFFIAYILVYLCVTSVSSFSTMLYLYRHMRSMALSGSCFNAPRIQRHMRVAVTGACQGAVYFFYVIYYLSTTIINFSSSNFVVGPWSLFTVTTLFISGTTVNPGDRSGYIQAKSSQNVDGTQSTV